MSQRLPIIDFADIKKRRDGGSLIETLREIGFFYLCNHGVEESYFVRLEEASKKFFNKPLLEKSKFHMHNVGKVWKGFFELEGELTAGAKDYKEGLYFGREIASNDPRVKAQVPMHGPNQWPEEFLAMRQAILEYFASLQEVASELLSLVSQGLGMPAEYFQTRFLDEPTILFRIFHYPKNQASERKFGVHEHTDMGFLTLLWQDCHGGLQVKAKDGTWIDAPPIKGTLVVNIGDILELWTRGILRATPHRVLNISGQDRLSFPFFFDPSWDSPLHPIDADLLQQHREHWRDTSERWDQLDLHRINTDITYGEFVWTKVEAVFPKLAGKS